MSLQSLLAELISGDEVRAENAAIKLAALNDEAIPALLNLTRSPNADQRWWAIRTLALAPHSLTVHLIPLLSDSAPEVRAATALAFHAHPDEKAVPALCVLLSDVDPLVAQLAGNALSVIGSPAVLNLLSVLKDARQSARIQALRALAEIRDHRAIPLMMKVMEEESSLLQYWAKEGLERLGLDMVYIKPG